MKVLLINSGHNRGGGAFTVYLNTGEVLRKAGVNVIYFAMHSSKEIPCDQSDYFAKEIGQNTPLKYISSRFYNKDAADKLQRLIDAEHPDVAHAHLIWGGLAPSILDVLQRNHIPIIHTVHDYAMICSMVTLKGLDGKVCEKCSDGHYCQSIITRCHHGSILRSLIATAEFIYRLKKHHPVDLINHFIFVSQFCQDKHSQIDGRFKNVSQSVLYNVPDEEVVKLAMTQSKNNNQGYYLYYGRLSYEKGLRTLINAFIERAYLKLKIVGTGPLEAELKDLCKKVSVNNIEFVGFKTGEELYKIVQGAKFVCVPSEWYENNPMTIIEAYTLGVPVIAANIGGIPEIVEDKKTGFLFESRSKDDLLNKLQLAEALSGEDYSNMKMNCKLFSDMKFKREEYAGRLIQLYKKVINQIKQKGI